MDLKEQLQQRMANLKLRAADLFIEREEIDGELDKVTALKAKREGIEAEISAVVGANTQLGEVLQQILAAEKSQAEAEAKEQAAKLAAVPDDKPKAGKKKG